MQLHGRLPVGWDVGVRVEVHGAVGGKHCHDY